ncbi:Ig domain-containing protein [Neptuniibacter sp. QD37_11]|uniref:Ig domain-containing protein n=1 Tax=Neptuniibacter sp. QD37_11 TaxID=3398209 RepID=UPI0039F5245E
MKKYLMATAITLAALPAFAQTEYVFRSPAGMDVPSNSAIAWQLQGQILTSVNSGQAVSADLNAYVQSDTPVVLAWSSVDLPSGLSLSQGGVLSGSIANGGNYTFNATAEGEGATHSADFSLAVGYSWALQDTDLPVVYHTPDMSIDLNEHVVTSGAPDLAWSSAGLPSGVALSGEGILYGQPTYAGRHDFTVTASDGQQVSSSAFKLHIEHDWSLNASNTTITAYAGQYMGYNFMSDLSHNPIYSTPTYSVTGLPEGLSLDYTGHLSGMTNEHGAHPITLTVTAGDRTVTQNYTLQLNLDCIDPNAVEMGTISYEFCGYAKGTPFIKGAETNGNAVLFEYNTFTYHWSTVYQDIETVDNCTIYQNQSLTECSTVAPSGKENTLNIKSHHEAIGAMSAAQACTQRGEGWFLPSLGEFQQLSAIKDRWNGFIPMDGQWYWTSTEFDFAHAKVFNPSNDYHTYVAKGNGMRIRCARSWN